MKRFPAKKLFEKLNPAKFSNSQKLRLVFLAIILGIFLGQWEFFPKYLLLIGFLFLIAAFWFKKMIIGIFAGFLLANSYAQWRNFAEFQNDSLPQFVGQEVEMVGEVISFPDVREKNTRVVVEAKSIKICDLNQCQQNPAKISGKLLLVANNPAKLDYGNKISVQGKIVFPSSFSANFDYRKYLKRFGVQTIMKNPAKFSILEIKGGNPFLQSAKKSRNFLEKNLTKSLPSPHENIAMGVLLGVKNELPKWTQSDFKNSGLQHLLVVSGTNVTIVIIVISFLLRGFGRRISFAGSMLALIFFVLMTGADAPVLRASIMGAAVGIAIAWGKLSDVRNIILLSAVIIGLLSPSVLQNDIGFTLSFGATLGIIIGVPIFNKLFRGISNSPLRKGVGGFLMILAVSLSAQISILPVLIKNFGQFPVGGIPANLFAEPLMPFIMFFSFISSLAGALPEVIAKTIAVPAFVLLEILLQIARLFGQIPPIVVPDFLNNIFAIIILAILGYGLFSRDFEERFLILKKEEWGQIATCP